MEDLIRKQDAIDAIGADIDEIDAFDPSAGIMKACIRRAIWKVMGVPSADRRQGKWIKDENGDYRCSECGGCEEQFIYGTENWYGRGESNYCPSCGARMRGADDDL